MLGFLRGTFFLGKKNVYKKKLIEITDIKIIDDIKVPICNFYYTLKFLILLIYILLFKKFLLHKLMGNKHAIEIRNLNF